MTRRRFQRGVTLIELLIAISMLSLLSVGILMSMRMGLGTMARTNARLIQNRKVQGVIRVMEQEVSGLMPVYANCNAGGGASGVRIAFFQGESQLMRFVSSYSLQEAGRGYPRILEYLVIPGDEGNGVRLVVNEYLYSGPLSTGAFCFGLAYDEGLGVAMPQFRPAEAGTQSFVLADKLARCRFLYREAMAPPMRAAWTERWVKRGWPSGIRIEVDPLEPDPSRLQVSTLTIPVRITRDMDREYEDN